MSICSGAKNLKGGRSIMDFVVSRLMILISRHAEILEWGDT